MKIKKGLTFSQAVENIKANKKVVLALIAALVISIFLLIYLGENHIISEKAAVIMSQGIFLGVAVALWKIIVSKKGDKL